MTTTKVINAHPHRHNRVWTKIWQHRHLYLMLVIPIAFYILFCYWPMYGVQIAFKKYNVRYFFYNGGNDSMDTCQKIHAMALREGLDLRVIGIPKTMDNDLAVTDHCPGFGSAARYAAVNAAELALDAALPLKLTLDFSGVSFMDSSGIAVVMRAQRRMRALGGGAVLRQIPPQAKRVFDAAGIFRIIPLEEGGSSDEGKTE